MTKRYFDYIVIIVTAAVFMVLNSYGFLEKLSNTFIIILVLAYYLLGQYAERKFKK